MSRSTRKHNFQTNSVLTHTIDDFCSRAIPQRPGISQYNQIFEFPYSVRGHECDMLFTSVTGHMMGYEFEERYRGWKSVDPVELFTLPLTKSVAEVF
jgi:hypothetical protein